MNKWYNLLEDLIDNETLIIVFLFVLALVDITMIKEISYLLAGVIGVKKLTNANK